MRCDEEFELLWKDVQNNAAIQSIDSPKLLKKRIALPRTETCL